MTKIRGILSIVILGGIALAAYGEETFLHVSSSGFGQNQIDTFRVDLGTGALTATSSTVLPAGYGRALALAPTGPFLYTIASFPNTVAGFRATGGILEAVPGSPFAIGGTGAIEAAVDGLGRFLYVGNNVSADVAAYRIDSDGGLTPVPGQPIPATGVIGGRGLASDPAGEFLYLATGGSDAALSVYRIGSTGTLSHVPGSPFAAAPGPNILALDPSGRFLYAANETTSGIWAYQVNPESGELTPVTGSPFPAGPRPLAMTVDTLGRFVFVGNFDLSSSPSGQISILAIDSASGALTRLPGAYPAGNQPTSLLVPTGTALYATEVPPPFPGQTGNVWAYRIDASTGGLTLIDSYKAGVMPWALASSGRAPVPPPTAACQDVTLPADEACEADASVDAGSTGAEGHPIELSQIPPGPYGLGETRVQLRVTDTLTGASSICGATVTVVDRTPPAIESLSASPALLWPPNHKWRDVAVGYAVTDNCTPRPACSLDVSSNETSDTRSWEILDPCHLRLLAERDGAGRGRVYGITVSCVDPSGNETGDSVTVAVPHDRR